MLETMAAMSDSLDLIADVLWLSRSRPLQTFTEMWYHIFLWAFFSSVLIHTIAALTAFATLRKHRIGRFFPVLVFLMGILTPGTSGIITSATIAFVYYSSSFQLVPFYAFLYGTGQTLLFMLFSFTRILATFCIKSEFILFVVITFFQSAHLPQFPLEFGGGILKCLICDCHHCRNAARIHDEPVIKFTV